MPGSEALLSNHIRQRSLIVKLPSFLRMIHGEREVDFLQSRDIAFCLIVLINTYTCSRICVAVTTYCPWCWHARKSALLVMSYHMQVSKNKKSNKVSNTTSTKPVLMPDVSTWSTHVEMTTIYLSTGVSGFSCLSFVLGAVRLTRMKGG